MRCIDAQISAVERSVLAKVKARADYKALKTVSEVDPFSRTPHPDEERSPKCRSPVRRTQVSFASR
jgi:hypothetical protein